MRENDIQKPGFLKALEAIAPVKIEKDKSVICIVSPRLVYGQAGVSAQIFQAVADAGVSVRAFSQNASEIAQLLVVQRSDVEKAIKSLHDSLIQNCPC